MEKLNLEKINQETTKNINDRRNGNGRRKKKIRSAEAYHLNQRNNTRRDDDKKAGEEIEKNPLPFKDKLDPDNTEEENGTDLFKNYKEE